MKKQFFVWASLCLMLTMVSCSEEEMNHEIVTQMQLKKKQDNVPVKTMSTTAVSNDATESDEEESDDINIPGDTTNPELGTSPNTGVGTLPGTGNGDDGDEDKDLGGVKPTIPKK